MRVAPAREAFRAAGFASHHVFPHEVAWIPKAYPDSHLHLRRRGVSESSLAAARFWQLNLYATDLSGLDPQLFTDLVINWHGQHFGRPGLVAAAGLAVVDGRLVVTFLQSDLMQQVFRADTDTYRSARSPLDQRFGSWYRPLVNAVLDFAIASGFDRVFVPTSSQLVRDTAKRVDPTFFGRIYDSVEDGYSCERISIEGADYRAIPVDTNHDRIVRLLSRPVGHPGDGARTILFHDVEANVDTDIEPATCRAHLDRILGIEHRHGLRLTYDILGTLFDDLRDTIARDGHELAFHSYDHAIGDVSQLGRCRSVDGQVHGYRPARSLATAELTPANLAAHNFEWLLTSSVTLGYQEPRLIGGVVHLPVRLDDYSLHMRHTDEGAWRERARSLRRTQDVLAIGLHDCYAASWLDWYDAFLDELQASSRLVTAGEVAGEVFLAAAEDAQATIEAGE